MARSQHPTGTCINPGLEFVHIPYRFRLGKRTNLSAALAHIQSKPETILKKAPNCFHKPSFAQKLAGPS
jgi:hypothetical protein